MYYSSRHAVPKWFRTSTQNSTSHSILGNSRAVTSSIAESYAGEPVQVSSVLVARGGKKKGRKARTTVIAELDTSTGEFSSGTDTPRKSKPRSSFAEHQVATKLVVHGVLLSKSNSHRCIGMCMITGKL